MGQGLSSTAYIFLPCNEYTIVLFKHVHAFLRRPRVSPHAVGCGRGRGAPGLHGASLGSGWAPWNVPWLFKVVKSRKHSLGRFPRRDYIIQYAMDARNLLFWLRLVSYFLSGLSRNAQIYFIISRKAGKRQMMIFYFFISGKACKTPIP